MERLICTVLALLVVLSAPVQATALDVLAIEYPPYTSAAAENKGLAFAKLAEMLKGSDLQLRPRFYSPARAHREIREGHWCASFYPAESATNATLVALDHQRIRLGLFRRAEPGPFRWQTLDQLGGSRIAYYRAQERDGLGLELERAGVELFDIATYRQGLQLLQRGRVDYVFGDQQSGLALMQELGMDPAAYQFSASDFGSVTLQVWINLDCAEGLSLFEQLKPRQ